MQQLEWFYLINGVMQTVATNMLTTASPHPDCRPESLVLPQPSAPRRTSEAQTPPVAIRELARSYTHQHTHTDTYILHIHIHTELHIHITYTYTYTCTYTYTYTYGCMMTHIGFPGFVLSQSLTTMLVFGKDCRTYYCMDNVVR